MRTAILITPTSKTIPVFEEADYIGVDAGALLLIENHVPCAFAVGDFDSLDEEALQKVEEVCPVYRHPIMKDETDSELAIQICTEKGYDSIYLYGALSKRLDHTLANIRLMMYRYPKVICFDETQSICVLEPGRHEIIKRYKHVSFFSIEPSILSLQGFLYPLEHQKVFVEDIYCTSNSIVDDVATVLVESGKVLCVQSNDR